MNRSIFGSQVSEPWTTWTWVLLLVDEVTEGCEAGLDIWGDGWVNELNVEHLFPRRISEGGELQFRVTEEDLLVDEVVLVLCWDD